MASNPAACTLSMMRQAISARFAISIFFIIFHPYLSVIVF
jgi:hypothetical protein